MELLLRRIVLLTLLLAVPSVTYAYRIPDRDYWRRYIVTLINQSREEHDLPVIGLDEDLTDMSQVHAQDTAVNFDDTSDFSRRSSYLAHDSSDGRTFPDRVHGRNFAGLQAAGENAGFRYRGPIEELQQMIKESAELIHDGMMTEMPPDDGHRQTILGDYTHVGVGIEFHRDLPAPINTVFFVTDFAKFGPERAQSMVELGPAPAPIYTADLRGTTEEEPVFVSSPRTQRGTTIALPESSWVERNRSRVEAKRNERLARLLQRVEERRQARLKRRGF